MVSDLETERTKSQLDLQSLRRFIVGENVTYYEVIRGILENHPELFSPSDLDYLHMSPKEKYEMQVRRFASIMTIVKNGEIDPKTQPEMFYHLLVVVRMPVIGLHVSMVVPALRKLMSDEQWSYWEPLCLSFKAIFAYAQTEIGHGTWLSNLETTAVFDESNDEFVLNSNTLTGYKFWPGFMGKGCSHVLTMAQLIIAGQNYGPHLFVVPIRCTKTYKQLEGIDCGDIGPTYWFYDRDNGFLGFKNVRIPRSYMLMRHQSVSKDGVYTKGANPKVLFGAMLKIRSEIVQYAAFNIAIGATIATRYSIVRRQCALKPGEDEMRIVDYLTQQDKLFPAICSFFALQTAYRHLRKKFVDVESEMSKENFDEVTQLHYLLAGLKAFASSEALKRLVVLRGACGGHGFSLSSNLPPLISEAEAMCTYEGDNTVMNQQSARNLVRCFMKKSMGEKQSGFLCYLDQSDMKPSHVTTTNQLLNFELLQTAYEQRSRYLLTYACTRLQDGVINQGLTQEDAWINNAPLLVNSSIAHAHLFIVTHFILSINEHSKLSYFPNLEQIVLHKLCYLYCLLGIRDHLADFILCGFFDKSHAPLIVDSIHSLYKDLRPHILPLAEGCAFPDMIINSTIGAEDGRAYERLMDWARKSQTNDLTFQSEMFQKYLKPVLQMPSKL